MPNLIKDIHKVDAESFDYIYEENVSIHLNGGKGLVRCNVYRPKTESGTTYPVLVTYGPYGKDIHYSQFHQDSFSDVPEDHHSPHSAWQTPDPGFWTRHDYAVVRADELGRGQSPGKLDTMSRGTSEAFFDVVEWAAVQPWSSGKVGLLGISYYAGSQWRVAARQPKGLACIIPWEGMSDYYRDRCRHGGILSNTFISFWWNRQDQNIDNATYRFRDDDYYASKDYDMSNIRVPLLSVGNWGGVLLHLRGNIEGYMNASSDKKYLRLITGRHDLPFYSKENVELQKSFLDAFLKGHDTAGWSTGTAPIIGLTLRKGNVGYNDATAEKQYQQRFENEWPIARTNYIKYFLSPSMELLEVGPQSNVDKKVSYPALGNIKAQQHLRFTSSLFLRETEFTGHIVAHLNVSASSEGSFSGEAPSDIDVFITLRHLDWEGKEIVYTGTVGDPVPITKGWLRVSLRKVASESPRNRPWHPHREYLSKDVDEVVPGKVYEVDVEVWPTNVIVGPGNRLVLVSSGDTDGAGLFEHTSPSDRSATRFSGTNHIHFGNGRENWLLMPHIPSR